MMRQQAHMALDQLLNLGELLLGRQVPQEAREHFRNARREVLLGVRSMVDQALTNLDQAQAAPGGARSIPVEEE